MKKTIEVTLKEACEKGLTVGDIYSDEYRYPNCPYRRQRISTGIYKIVGALIIAAILFFVSSCKIERYNIANLQEIYRTMPTSELQKLKVKMQGKQVPCDLIETELKSRP